MIHAPQLARWLATGILFASGALYAQTKEATFAYQDALVPLRTLIDSGELEKTTGYKINWRHFGTGGEVNRALATGDVQIGEVDSNQIAVAASQGHDVRLFWILHDTADALALVARDGAGIKGWKDLKGKKVATPFASSAYSQLLAGLKLEGIDPKDVNLVDLGPLAISAAWARGDIDATFIGGPVLSKAKANGKVIATAGSIGRKGHPIFDGLVVHESWAKKNEDFLVALVKAVAKADDDYRKNAARWTADSAPVKAVAKWSKVDPTDVPAAIALYRFPTLEEQLSSAWLGGGAAKTLANTAVFLKEHGRIQTVQPDYGIFVTTTYVQKALGH
jgi:taurine transport system substrate-binding protein